MKTPSRRQSTSRFNYLVLFGIFLIAVVGLALPAVHSRSSAESSVGDKANYRVPGYSNLLPGLAPAALAGETIEIFAADCATPKTAFAAGETICAKTDGVDLTTVPNNYYVNWFHPDSSETNGGTITTNPQYSLFSIPTSGSYLGTWKANIGRVTPAEGSIIGNPPLFTVSAAPTIATFAYSLGSCTNTPKTNFVIGDTVCARVVGVDPQFNRRFAWVDADGITREFTPITTDPQTDDFAILLTETSFGTWKANVVSSRGTTVVGTPFTVAGATPSVDLSISKASNSSELKSGEDATFTIAVFNRGPSDAQNVVITDVTPANLTFVPPATQTEGSGFTCTGTSTVTCTGAILKPGERAVFEFVYTPGAAGQTVTNTATVDSDTAEAVAGSDTDGDTIDDASEDNSSTAGPFTISPGSGGGGDTCSVGCPDDIQTPANTTQSGQDGAIVHFSPPTGNDECGTILVDHCNDCFFPQGDTLVTATASTGETCSFTVTVTAPGTGTTISCPSNKTANADASECSTNVIVGTATATGTNVTVVGYRSDGQAMYNCDVFGNCVRKSSDAPFPAGTTTITWYAYSHDVPGPYTGPVDGNGDPVNESDTEEAHRTGSATCSQTVKVNDVTPPVIAATDSTVSADASCQAVIPDYSNTVTDNCACGSADDSEDCEGHPHIIYTQTPAAGTVVGPGAHNVHIEATDGSENNNGATKDVTFTVEDTTAPVIDCPDNISTTTDPGTCSAVVDPGTATATDNCDTSPAITWTRSDGQTSLNAPYPKGTTTITWRATDDEGNYTECEQTVTVVDDEAPVITFNGVTPSMWPPNHDYRNFTTANFISSVSDNCDSLSVNDVYITKVTSDEAEESLTLGDGTTFNDMVIAADCKSVQLRAERVNSGNGRVYTIHFKLVDSSGNVTTGTAKVHSPKNQNQAAVEDAPMYTVNSTCP